MFCFDLETWIHMWRYCIVCQHGTWSHSHGDQLGFCIGCSYSDRQGCNLRKRSAQRGSFFQPKISSNFGIWDWWSQVMTYDLYWLQFFCVGFSGQRHTWPRQRKIDGIFWNQNWAGNSSVTGETCLAFCFILRIHVIVRYVYRYVGSKEWLSPNLQKTQFVDSAGCVECEENEHPWLVS